MTEDGSIVINTKIRTDGVKAGAQEIEAGLRRAADRVDNLGTSAKNAINKQIDAFAKLNNEYSAQEQKVESLRQKVASYANQRIPTTEYKEISDQISKAEAKLNQLTASQERFVANGGKKNTSTYKKMQYDIDELANTIKYARSELIDLEVSGKAFSTGVNTKEAQADMERLASAERRLTDMQNRLNTSYSGIKSKLASYGTGLVSLKEKLFGVNSANNKTANSNSKLSRSFKDTSKSAGSARMSIGRMLTMSLLFSSVFRILSALTQGIIGGFNNLAQYSKTTNANISTLWGSLIRLQNAFATAFSPILEVVTPILSRFIDLISTAITYVGMFFGYLAGNKTYTKALAVQKDYAASLDKTAKSTKKATKAAKDYLSPLDEINRYTTNKDTDTAPSGSDVNGTPISKMFEEVPIDAPPIFEKIKDVLGQIFQPFKEAWEREGKNTIDATYDISTFCGALESSLQCIMDRYPLAVKLYIIPHSFAKDNSYVDSIYSKAIEICDKWNMPYLDMRVYSQIAMTSVNKGKYTYNPNSKKGDGVHPNETWYRTFYCPVIDQALQYQGIGSITASEAPEIVAVKGVKLDRTTLTLDAGDSAQLTATVSPDNATNKSVTWSANNSNVSVSGGKVTAKTAGSAVVTVTTADGGYTAQCNVTVNASTAVDHTELTSLSLDGNCYFDTEILPDENTNTEAKWNLQSGTTYIAGAIDDNYKFGYTCTDNFYAVRGTVNSSPKPASYWNGDWIINQTGVSYQFGDTTVATDAIDSFKLSSPYYLGNMSKNSTPSGTGVVGKIYYAQIYSGDTLVADMIPVKKSDGTLCLYDKVRKKYIYNDGTGTVTE